MRDEDRGTTEMLKQASLTGETVPKLGRRGVVVSDLDGYPVHSPARNPMADAQTQQLAIQNIQADRQDGADGDLRRADGALRDVIRRGGSNREIATARQDMDAATSALSAAHATPALRDALPGAG